jgi:hypothetical protein
LRTENATFVPGKEKGPTLEGPTDQLSKEVGPTRNPVPPPDQVPLTRCTITDVGAVRRSVPIVPHPTPQVSCCRSLAAHFLDQFRPSLLYCQPLSTVPHPSSCLCWPLRGPRRQRRARPSSYQTAARYPPRPARPPPLAAPPSAASARPPPHRPPTGTGNDGAATSTRSTRPRATRLCSR